MDSIRVAGEAEMQQMTVADLPCGDAILALDVRDVWSESPVLELPGGYAVERGSDYALFTRDGTFVPLGTPQAYGMIDAVLVITHAQAVLDAAELDVAAADLLDDVEGLARLALLCNALGKDNPALYRHKSYLLAHLLSRLEPGAWCWRWHTYGDTYTANTVIFVETRAGQMAFHVRLQDGTVGPVLTDDTHKPDAQWSGVALQPRARELMAHYLEEIQDARVG